MRGGQGSELFSAPSMRTMAYLWRQVTVASLRGAKRTPNVRSLSSVSGNSLLSCCSSSPEEL